MPGYRVPEGYLPDADSGLYYKESILTAPDGCQVRHIYWFNADTGEYAQSNYPIGPTAIEPPAQRTRKHMRRRSKRLGLRAIAGLLCLLILFFGSAAVVRTIRAPRQGQQILEEITELVEISEPDEETAPRFAPYEGTLHEAEEEEAP